MAVAKGQRITAKTMNEKMDVADLVPFGEAIDKKINDTVNYTIFVGTDAQWAALPIAERNKYLMRGVPK